MRRTLIAGALLALSCGGDMAESTVDASSTADVRIARDAQFIADASSGDVAALDAGAPDSGSGSGCSDDPECSDGIFCNGIERCFQGLCFPSPTTQCSDPSLCTRDQCDEVNKRCEFIPDDSLCAPGQVCDSKAGCFSRTGCTVDSDCDDGLVCNGDEVCMGSQCEPGTPVACDDGIACTQDTCVEPSGECQTVSDHARCLVTELCVVAQGCSPRPPCDRDDDCDDGLFCNGVESCGADNVCVPGAPPAVVDTVDCTIDQCSETLDMVVNTPDNARCSDGAYCNGAEVCHPVNGCGPGAPPVVSDGVGCTADSCDESIDFIVHTPDDTLCDDGLFCNGAEVCHPIDDCSPGEPPAINDGVGCTIDTCSEVMDVVLHVPDDSTCGDGLFCNGVETCDAVADCQSGVVPQLEDGFACTTDTCDEASDMVTHTPVDAVCDDGDPCNGSESCSTAVGCQMGTPLPVDDGIACTIDACDPQTGVSNTPMDSLCDNGAFCDGSETCSTTNGCEAGTAPGDDGNACTSDVCDEATDMVSHPPANDGTVCASGPRSICLSGNCGASFCGDGFTDPGRGEECDDGGTTPNDGCDGNCQIETGGSCDPDGIWDVPAGQGIAQDCCFMQVNISISSFVFSMDGSRVDSSPSNPVQMTGSTTTCPSGSFSVTGTLPGGCNETYTLTGNFDDADTWSGTYTTNFTGVDCGCAGLDPCVGQTFILSGVTRR